MDKLIEETVEALRGAGWNVELAPAPQPLPAHIAERYPHIPQLAAEFITSLARCERGDEGCWFLTAPDYERPPVPDGFRWDEFERIFTEPGEPPEGMRRAPRTSAREIARDLKGVMAAGRFWSVHLPIFQFVAGDYEYMAIDVGRTSPRFGKVIGTDLLDYDAQGVMAEGFADLLTQLRDVARREPTRSAVYDNYLTLFVHADIIEDGSRPPWERRGLLGRLRGWMGGS